MTVENLIQKAIEVQTNSYSPYSNFMVGAALLAKNGQVFTGCNLESVAFSPTICAERAAIAAAVSQGVTEFVSIAVVGKKRGCLPEQIEYISPCGVCRQTLVEFCDKSFLVYLAKTPTNYQTHTLEDLLPCSFSSSELLDT